MKKTTRTKTKTKTKQNSYLTEQQQIQLEKEKEAAKQAELAEEKEKKEREDSLAAEMFAYETYCMDSYLQWLQLQRQQMINFQFARPDQHAEGELGAYNRSIAKLEQMILERNDYFDLATHGKPWVRAGYK